MTDFQEIYEMYFKDVYKYALSLCRDESIAEEITQETFFKALKSIDSFRGQCRLHVWLCQIAKNHYYTYVKKMQPQPLDVDLSADMDLEDHFVQQESAFEIHRILHRMPEPYREVFSLRVFGQLSFRQIGELFEKTESWARVTYHRARMKIKEEIT